jgi:hypothetical protein
MNSAEATVGPFGAAAWSGIAACDHKLCTASKRLLLTAGVTRVLVESFISGGAVPAVEHTLP